MTALRHYYLHQLGIDPWVLRTMPVSSSRSKLMVIGSNFLGKAGVLVRNMLSSIGLSSDEYTIIDETASLATAIDEHAPEVLLAFGETVGCALLHDLRPLSALRASTHEIHGIPLVVSYHPTDLLGHSLDKKEAYQDVLRVQQLLQGPHLN